MTAPGRIEIKWKTKFKWVSVKIMSPGFGYDLLGSSVQVSSEVFYNCLLALGETM